MLTGAPNRFASVVLYWPSIRLDCPVAAWKTHTLSNGKATLTVTVATWNASTQTYGSDTTVTSSTFAPKQYDKISVKVAVNASDVTWAFLKYTAGDVESETVVMMRQ